MKTLFALLSTFCFLLCLPAAAQSDKLSPQEYIELRKALNEIKMKEMRATMDAVVASAQVKAVMRESNLAALPKTNKVERIMPHPIISSVAIDPNRQPMPGIGNVIAIMEKKQPGYSTNFPASYLAETNVPVIRMSAEEHDALLKQWRAQRSQR